MAQTHASGDDPAKFVIPRPRQPDLALGLVVAAIALVVLMLTERDFGMVWDEGFTVVRERVLDDWFSRLGKPTFPRREHGMLAREELDKSWPFSREEPDGHPPFYALLGLAGWHLSHGWLRPLSAYRFGPMVLFAATCGAVAYHLARRQGRLAGVTAAAILLLMPRPFAHAHYAHYDMPMTCLWLLAQMAFVSSLEEKSCCVPFGICLGLAAGTKFTGLFALVPPMVWVGLFEILPLLRGARRGPMPGLRCLAFGLPIAIGTLYAIQPPWWIAPIAGPMRFLASNLTRAKTQPLPTLYMGRVYEFSLPWHNTIVLTAITTPPFVLLLASVGILACIKQRKAQPWMMIWPLSWLTLMVVRALPNAPGHDGIRLFLPSIASLAILAGIGLAWAAERPVSRWALAMVFIAPIADCLAGIAKTYPYTDSYYNRLIGGLPGAERHGFELTYYWETSGPEFLEWLRKEKARRPVGLNFLMHPTNHRLLREWGELPRDVPLLDPDRPERPDYVQQRRRAFFYPEDTWLDRHGTPIFTIRREGVALLRVYPFEQWVEACRRTGHVPIPKYLSR